MFYAQYSKMYLIYQSSFLPKHIENKFNITTVPGNCVLNI